MAWLEDSNTQDGTKKSNEFLKFAELKNAGETDIVRIRILDESPEGVWQHWLNGRPYNCLGTLDCPVCIARNAMKRQGGDEYKKTFQLTHRSFFNVLVDGENGPEVKVYGFSPGVERDLKATMQMKGDLRGYDLTVQKRKTGQYQQNVEYKVFYDGPRDLSDQEKAVSENRHDLTQYIRPASIEDLREVAAGRTPVYGDPQQSTFQQAVDSVASSEMDGMFDRLEAFASSRGITTMQLAGFDRNNPPTPEVLRALVTGLTSAATV